ncbi:MAG: radical SAM protein [Lachnospiraceae bacterium]
MKQLSYEDCVLCPRACRVNRSLSGQKGLCGMSDRVRIARAALHFWEETCISGKEGSGAVFFSGCNLRCVFCQNREISAGGAGTEISVERLLDIFMELQEQGANNINLVTPTHYLLSVAEALEKAKQKGLRVPVVYNCGGYESVEALKRIEGLVDIYLPDYKYVSAELAARYSAAADYPQRAWEALAEMYRQTGEAVLDERGMMRRGVIVRHLILPGHTKEAIAVLQKLYATYGNTICYSIMNQYTPLPYVAKGYPELNRRLTKREYDKVIDAAVSMGIENGYIQEGETAKESFIPPFDGTGTGK